MSPPSSYKSTKITTAEQPLAKNAGTYPLPPTQKKYPASKNKQTKKSHNNLVRGVLSWSNQFPYPPDGPPTNQKMIIPQKLSHRSGSSEPRVRLPSLGDQQRVEYPENLALKARRVWLKDFHRTWGNRNSTLGKYIKSHVYEDSGEKSNDPIRDGARPIC